MNTEIARDLKRELAEPSRVASLLGLKRAPDSRVHWMCPRHGGASLSLKVGQDRTLWAKCFGCDFAGDVLSLIAEVERLDVRTDFRAVLEHGCELAGAWHLLDALRAPSTPRAPQRGAGPAPLDARAQRAPSEVYDPPAPPALAPEAEVTELWATARFPTQVPEVARYLAGRGLDVDSLWRRDLVRVLHEASPTFAWTTFGKRTWFQAGYVILVPVFDHDGAMRGLRAWNPAPAEGMPKRIAPKGCTVRGLVMADFLGLPMLRGELLPDRVAIAEGEPDFLTLASETALLARGRWATLGVEAGAWTEAISGRVPDGARVTIWTHADGPGEKYAEDVARTLLGRCVISRGQLQAAA